MNEKIINSSSLFIPRNYIIQGNEALIKRDKLINNLINQRKLPDENWPDSLIEYFLNQLSMMDTNNFIDNCGMGEREGRVYSELVKRRHFYFAHGIGRSGDIIAVQVFIYYLFIAKSSWIIFIK